MSYNRTFSAKGCCDGGTAPDICCGAAKRFSRSGTLVMGDWAGVSSGASAFSYCTQQLPNAKPDVRAACAALIDNGVNPTTFINAHKTDGGGSSSSTASDIIGGLGKLITGGILGAQQASAAQTQAMISAQAQAARAKQIQMLVILGVAGIGAFMLLRRGD